MSAAITAAVGATVVGSMLADDNGASAANGAAADSSRLQAEIARDQWNQYKELYQPLEKQYLQDVENYDSNDAYAKAAGDAQATVSSQFAKARGQLARTPGLDTSSAAYQSGMVGLGLQEAASGAVAQNQARQKVKDVAFARKTDALSLGKGMPANASSALASSTSASLGLASLGYNQANQQAGALGSVLQRGGTALNGWLGSASPRTSEVGNTGIYNGGDMSTGSTFDW